MSNYTIRHEEPRLTPEQSEAVIELAKYIASTTERGLSIGAISNQIIKHPELVAMATDIMRMSAAVPTQQQFQDAAKKAVQQCIAENGDELMVRAWRDMIEKQREQERSEQAATKPDKGRS